MECISHFHLSLLSHFSLSALSALTPASVAIDGDVDMASG